MIPQQFRRFGWWIMLIAAVIGLIVQGPEIFDWIKGLQYNETAANVALIAACVAVGTIVIGAGLHLAEVIIIQTNTRPFGFTLLSLIVVAIIGFWFFSWTKPPPYQDRLKVAVLVDVNTVSYKQAEDIARRRLLRLEQDDPIPRTSFDYQMLKFSTTDQLIARIRGRIDDGFRQFVVVSQSRLQHNYRFRDLMQNNPSRSFLIAVDGGVSGSAQNVFWIAPDLREKLETILAVESSQEVNGEITLIRSDDLFGSRVERMLRGLAPDVYDLEIAGISLPSGQDVEMENREVEGTVIVAGDGGFYRQAARDIADRDSVRRTYLLSPGAFNGNGIERVELTGQVEVVSAVLSQEIGTDVPPGVLRNYAYAIEMIRYGWTRLADEDVARYRVGDFHKYYLAASPRPLFGGGMAVNVFGNTRVIPRLGFPVIE